MAEQRGDLFHTIHEEILNFLTKNIFFIAVFFKGNYKTIINLTIFHKFVHQLFNWSRHSNNNSLLLLPRSKCLFNHLEINKYKTLLAADIYNSQWTSKMRFVLHENHTTTVTFLTRRGIFIACNIFNRRLRLQKNHKHCAILTIAQLMPIQLLCVLLLSPVFITLNQNRGYFPIAFILRMSEFHKAAKLYRLSSCLCVSV